MSAPTAALTRAKRAAGRSLANRKLTPIDDRWSAPTRREQLRVLLGGVIDTVWSAPLREWRGLKHPVSDVSAGGVNQSGASKG